MEERRDSASVARWSLASIPSSVSHDSARTMSSAKNTKNRSMGRERREGSNLGEWNPILEEREKCFGAHTFEKDPLFGY